MQPLHFVITGAARGIGFELAKQARAEGHRVSVLVRTPAQAEALRALGVEVHGGDVTSATQVAQLAKALSAPVDVLINNAGVYLSDSQGETTSRAMPEFSEIKTEHLMRSFDVNTLGAVRVTQACLPLLRKAKQPKVIQITSLMGSIADNSSGGYYGYRMSKAALNMFNKSLSIDFPEMICAVVHPGWVQTDMGGAEAPVPPAGSARGIHRIIAGLKPADTGKFFDFEEGEELPW